MAVSFLEQRITPLVEVVPCFRPFGPIGIAPWQELVEDRTLPLTPLLASECKLGRSHSWAGFAPHTLSGRELEKPTQLPALARGQILNYSIQESDGTPQPMNPTCMTKDAAHLGKSGKIRGAESEREQAPEPEDPRFFSAKDFSRSTRSTMATAADDGEALAFLPASCNSPNTTTSEVAGFEDSEAFITECLASIYSPASGPAKSGSQTSAMYPVQKGGSCPGTIMGSFDSSISQTSDHGEEEDEEEEGAMFYRAHMGGSFDSSIAQMSDYGDMEGSFESSVAQMTGQGEVETAPDTPWMHQQAALSQAAAGVEQAGGPLDLQRRPASAAAGGVTTVMVQNLARKLSRAGFMEVLDRCGFRRLYDFVHLPGVFGTGKNKGFAFVNFVTERAAAAFSSMFPQGQNNRGAEVVPMSVQDPSGWRVVPAAVQGLAANSAMAGSRKMRRVRNNAHRPLFLPQGGIRGGGRG